MTRPPKRIRKPRKSSAASAPNVQAEDGRVRVRHYCQGIGDCHLLRFPKKDGGFFWMLIDCGVHTSVSGGGDTIRRIVKNIREVTDRIDVLVVTHEHWDHVSGFLSAAEEFAELDVGAVWMAWTENGEDGLAKELDKFRAMAMSSLQDVGRQLDRAHGLGGQMAGMRKGLDALMGFQFGAKGERVRAARDAAKALAPDGKPVYLGPDTAPIELADVPGLRIYVLGPPRDRAALGVEVKAGEMYGVLGRNGWLMDNAMRSLGASEQGAFVADPCAPFDAGVGMSLSAALSGSPDDQGEDMLAAFLRTHYSGAPAIGADESARAVADAEDAIAWRRIDADWLAAGAELAIRLDRGINNSSLVLAFEFVDTGRVLLFPGDAQAGNWLSWEKVGWDVGGVQVNANDLLARTVYLKVAHHGSHNATLRQKGLELMNSPDLAAFIPTNEADAKKVGWGEMPFHDILQALAERTAGRVVRADDPWIGDPAKKPGFTAPSGAVRSMSNDPGGLWVEFDLA